MTDPRLGRIKSDEDPRNFRLSLFMGGPAPTKLEALLDALKYTTLPPSMKAWAKEVTKLLVGREPIVPQPEPIVVANKRWSTKSQLDQGTTPHCTGFAWAHWSNALPTENTMSEQQAHSIYYRAKEIDGEPRAENGSTIHSSVKAMKDLGRVDAYAWTTDLEEIKQWVLTKGPMVVGTYWYAGMFDPNGTGYVHPTGSIEGGHAYQIVGYSRGLDVFTFQNSWGKSWGDNGFFYMHANEWFSVFSKNNDGEACATVELALT